MRRKVIQHFANMFPQRFIDLPEGYDLALLARAKRGVASFNLLEGTASIDGVPEPLLRTASSYREWLHKEAAAHGVELEGIRSASMEVRFEVDAVEVEESFGHVSHSARFRFECASELRTDEKSYTCESSCERQWGYGWYWEQLFGVPARGI